MPKIFSPAGELGVKLRETLRSVERAFSDRRDAPLKHLRLATTSLPAAADYPGATLYDSTVDSPVWSDGSAWRYPLKATSVSAYGLTLIDDADAAAARTTLGLGTAAVKNTGTSGDAVPLMNGSAAFSGDVSGVSVFANGTSTLGSGAGQGVLFQQVGGTGFCQAFNFGTSAFIPLVLGGSSTTLRAGSTGVLVAGSTGTTLSVLGTTASAANLQCTGAGSLILRSTSARKYKDDIQPLSDKEADNLLLAQPVTYLSKAKADDPDRRHWGFVADDEMAHLPALINLDAEGAPDGFQYERVVVGLVNLVKRMDARIATLEAERHLGLPPIA